jgi:hypothetical protein
MWPQRKRLRRRFSGIFARILLVIVVVKVIPAIDGYMVHPQQQKQYDVSTLILVDVPSSQESSFISKETPIVLSPHTRIQQSTSVISSQTSPTDTVLSPLEVWCLSSLDKWYAKSQSFKCPFMRRRSGDLLDTLELIMKHMVIRKECWPLTGPLQAHRPAGTNKKTNTIKYKGRSLAELYDYVLQDWKPETDGKGYYITGKLTTPIFRDDCWFLGPDPDMPIHGLRKYVGVASHLFDYDTSRAILQSLEMIPEENALIAKWTLSGILRLPWRPALPTFSGTTIYHIDNDGLIFSHEESWDCSVMRAFCHTLFPDLANAIWNNSE